MLLVDLVLQGVKRFVQSQKIPFKPGFNLIYGGNESGKTTLFDCVIELLFPNRIIDLKKDWKSWKGSGPSRAGLTFRQAEVFYRILKDFNQNTISLSRRAPGQEKFEKLSVDVSEISAILSEELNLPSYQDYKVLFLESRFWLPSYLGLEKAEPMAPEPEKAPAPSPPRELGVDLGGMSYPSAFPSELGGPGMSGLPGITGIPGMSIPGIPAVPGVPGLGMPGTELLGADDGLTWEDKQKRLEELKAQLEQIKKIEEIQFEIDGIQAKVFEIEKEKEKVKTIDEELKKIEAELEKYRFFRNLPENIDQRIAQYNSLEESRAREIEAIDTKMAGLDEELRYYLAQPKLWQRSFFQIGAGLIGAGIFSFILKGFLNLGFLQWLGILLVPGVALIAYALWHFLSEETKKTELRDNLKRMEEQRRSVVKEYQVKGAVVKKLLEQLKCESTEELKDMLDAFRNLEAQKTELNRTKRELAIELDLERLEKEEAELKSKITGLEEKLRGLGVAGMEKGELLREISWLEGSLERAKQLGLIQPRAEEVPPISAPSAPEVGKTQMVMGARKSALPFWEEILESGGRVLGFSSNEMLEQIISRAKVYLQTLSGKHYLDFRKEGDQILVKLAEMEAEQELSQLGKTAGNLLYLALKFALLELAVQRSQFPILLDDPYLVLDEDKFLTVAKILKKLSGRTQVIIFSSQKIFAQEADQALSLS